MIDAGLRTRAEIHRRIYERLREEGIAIPILTRDMRVEGESPAARRRTNGASP